MPQKTKKQHFVPQFLLRNFVGDSGKVWAYDKSLDRSFLSSTEGVACDGYFYDDPSIAAVTGEEQFVEKALSKAEGKWSQALSPVLERARSKGHLGLSYQERMDLSQMMALQMVRTPLVRQDHDQMMHALVRVMKKHGATDEQLAKCNPPIPTSPQNCFSMTRFAPIRISSLAIFGGSCEPPDMAASICPTIH